jgi:hypothetical protein
MRSLLAFVLLLPLLTISSMAQWRSGNTTIYPEKLYPGENVVTITNERGIDKIRYRATPNTVVTIPSIPSCAGEVQIRVRVDDPTSNESLDLTLYDCDGNFISHTLQSENWTIR